MKKKIFLVISFIAIMGACTAPVPPSPVSPGLAPVQTRPPAESGWETLVKEAQKEGSLLLAGETLGATKDAMKQAFRSKYGINLEMIDGRGAEVVAKIKAERQAGLYLTDVGLFGISTIVLDVKPVGITLPLEPFLVLPDVKDTSMYRGGQLPFIDKERHAIALVAMSVPPMIINTDLVRPDEIKQHAELLQPKWKGKIALTDPSTSGAANNWFSHIMLRVMGREKGLQFMRDLAKQEIQITRDMRLHLEWVARGKYPVGIGQSMTLLAPFKEAGAPVGYPKLIEPSYLSGGAGNLFAFDKAPHPNAARLFVNWLLSQEGGNLFAPSLGYPSLRLDVPSDYMDPALVPPPSVTYKGEDDYVRSRLEMRKIAAEIFK